jgi:hypothetical protein
MTITFSELMNTNYSLQFLNESFINITVIPFEEEDGFDEEARNLDLTWKVKNFSGKVLNISITF